MGVFDRLRNILGAKANAVLDELEDPNQTLDYSYEKLLALLTDTRRHMADVLTAKKQIELEIARSKEQVQKYENEARACLTSGREDLAQRALQRKAEIDAATASLQAQSDAMQPEVEKLEEATKRLEAKIANFRLQKEVTKAQYSAAKAEVKISESVTGISHEMGNVGEAINRAHDKVDKMKARAGAIDELVQNGALSDSLDPNMSPVDRELAQASQEATARSDLERLKKEMGL